MCCAHGRAAHSEATVETLFGALAERVALLADAVGGLSTLVADRMLVREGQRVAAKLTGLEKLGLDMVVHPNDRCAHLPVVHASSVGVHLPSVGAHARGRP